MHARFLYLCCYTVAWIGFGISHSNANSSNHPPPKQPTSAKNPFTVEELNDLAWNYLDINLDSAKHFALQAIDLLPKDTYPKTVTYNALGTYYQRKGLYDSASFYFNQSLNIRKTLKDTLGSINSLLNLGSSLYDQGNYNLSINTLNTALTYLSYFPHNGDSIPIKGSILNSLGVSYIELGELSQAFKTLNQSYELRTKQNDSIATARTITNMGHLYMFINDYKTAEKLFLDAISIFKTNNISLEEAKNYKNLADVYLQQQQYELATKYYNQAKNIFLLGGYQDELAATYSSLGHLKELLKNLEDAIQDQTTALTLYKQINDLDGIATTYNHLGQISLKQERYYKAISYFEKAEEIADSLNITSLFINIYNGLSRAYSQLNDYEKAFKYGALTDNLYTQQNKVVNQLIKETYRLKVAEQEKMVLEERLAKEQAEQKRLKVTNYFIYGIGGALLLLFFTLTLNYQQKLKLKKAEEKERQRVLEINEIIQDQKIHKLDAVIEGQQSERIRISQQLHDRMGALLSILKIHFSEVSDSINTLQSNTEKRMTEVNSLIDEATQTVREISNDLRKGVLDEMGLKTAIEDLCLRVKETGKIEVETHTESIKDPLPPALEWAIYRNVEDNGKGFDPQSIPESESKSLGLKGMRVRTRKHKGMFSIDSKTQRGTIILMDFKIDTPETDGEEYR
ncbi:MAG: hypothetical protein CL843_14255 [Crocinitomicaceae bacterium]|nr:hypothetical protein [Crocinitomicaceae bacterium]|tara:strand:- start:5635 stop:7686 length:2052 start_codon:yes stop_codon:yes gene_type:complete